MEASAGAHDEVRWLIADRTPPSWRGRRLRWPPARLHLALFLERCGRSRGLAWGLH